MVVLLAPPPQLPYVAAAAQSATVVVAGRLTARRPARRGRSSRFHLHFSLRVPCGTLVVRARTGDGDTLTLSSRDSTIRLQPEETATTNEAVDAAQIAQA